ncbi:MAG TPA: hypothetical protein VIE66_19830 [Methylocella sp.]
MVEDATRLAYDVTKLEFDPLNMGIDVRTASFVPKELTTRDVRTYRKSPQDDKVAVRPQVTLQQVTNVKIVLLYLPL